MRLSLVVWALAGAALVAVPAAARGGVVVEGVESSADITAAAFDDEHVAADDLSGNIVRVDIGAIPFETDLDAYELDPSTGEHLFSTDTTVGLPGGVTARPGDVVRFDGTTFTIAFDAGVLPPGANVDAVASIGDDGDLLISTDTTFDAGGFTAAPADLVRWDGTAFSSFFEGVGYGLAPGLDLDGASYVEVGGRRVLYASFDGSGVLGGVAFDDRDVLALDLDSGVWTLAYTGAGGAGVDLDAVSVRALDGAADEDGDGLPNAAEIAAGTDLRDPDSDDDGLSDGDEVNVHATNPLSADTDGDGLDDAPEIARGTDPKDADTDDDGLDDGTEVARTTDPKNADTDGDGASDGLEVSRGSNPLVAPTPVVAFVSLDITTVIAGATVDDGDVTLRFDGGLERAALGALPVEADVDAFAREPSGDRLFSLDVAANLGGGVFAEPADVVRYDGATYSIAFRAADHGVPPGADVDAVTLVGADMAVSFDTTVELPGGVTAGPEDLVLFASATSSFSILFDGSASGLAPGANLDAAHVLPNGHVLLSADIAGSLTSAGGVVVLFDDADLVERDAAAGTFEVSPLGLETAVDVDAVAALLGADDADQDGLTNFAEAQVYGTNPFDPDTDGDGLGDGAEVAVHGSDPTKADTDGDGLPDGEEVALGTDPADPDSDGDGLGDGDERDVFLTDPRIADTDGDGRDDGVDPNPRFAATELCAVGFSTDVTVAVDALVVDDESVTEDRAGTPTPIAIGAIDPASDVDAYESGSALLSFDRATVVTGASGAFTALRGDVVRYDAGAGVFTLVFSAAANGLGDADVDAIAVSPADGKLLVSFAETVDLGGGLVADDEDLVRVDPSGPTPVYSLFFDGSAAGVDPAADLTGASVLEGGDLILAFDIAAAYRGVFATPRQALEHAPATGDWDVARFDRVFAEGTAIDALSASTGLTIAVPADTTVERCDPTDPAHTGSATATDGCGATPAISFQDLGEAGDCAGETTITRVWTATATDPGGTRTASGVQSIAVVDTTPPVFTFVPEPVSRGTGPAATSCEAPVPDSELGTATAEDTCAGGSVTIQRLGVPAGNLFPKGLTTVTYTTQDAAGNTATASQTVAVIDDTPPVITCPANVVASGLCSTVVSYPDPVATDNCSSVSLVCVPPSGATFPIGPTTVTCTATDASGNQAVCSFTVTVTGGTPATCAPIEACLDRSRVHFDRDGNSEFAYFRGSLSLTGGHLAQDFRDGLIANGTLKVTFGCANPVVVHCDPAIAFAVADQGSAADNREKWTSGPAKYRWKDDESFDAARDPNIPSSAATGFRNTGLLSTVFIHDDETRFRYNFKNATKPVTIAVDGIVLLTVRADGTATSPFPHKVYGKSMDVTFPCRLVPGATIDYYAGAPAALPASPFYAQEVVADGTAQATYYNAGARFFIKVPVAGIRIDSERCVKVEFTVGRPDLPSNPLCGETLGSVGCGSFEATGYAVVGRNWKIQDGDDECDDVD